MEIDYQRVSDATFMQRFLGINSLQFEEDVAKIREWIKEEFGVDLSYTEAFLFWAWRSDARATEPSFWNDSKDSITPDVDWCEVQEKERVVSWFKDFTARFLWHGTNKGCLPEPGRIKFNIPEDKKDA